MSKIEFLEDVTVNDRTRMSYKKGQIVELSDASCMHWIKRGKAKFVYEDSKKEVKNNVDKTKEIKQDKEIKSDKKV